MAEYTKLEITKRARTGSHTAKLLRKEGMIPTNYYYTGQDNVNLAIDKKVFRQAVHTGHHIFAIDMNGEEQYVMIKEVQYHPVSDEIIHIDLMRVRRDQKMTISVPIVLEGNAIGVKEGGILTQNLTTLEISCFPADVPENIIVDVSDFEMNHVMTVGELKVDEKIEIVTAEDMDVLAIIPPREESLEPEIPTEEELAEVEAEVEGEEVAETDEAPQDEPTESEQKEETSDN